MVTFMCLLFTFALIQLGEAMAIASIIHHQYAELRAAMTVRTTDAPNTQNVMGAMPRQARMYARPALVAPAPMGHAALSRVVVGWLGADERREIRAERRAANIAAMAREAVEAAVDQTVTLAYPPVADGSLPGAYRTAQWLLANSWAMPSTCVVPSQRVLNHHHAVYGTN